MQYWRGLLKGCVYPDRKLRYISTYPEYYLSIQMV
uniref:Uncharacterized protein n=1 Tax=Anguilla anguilla TaxID=7936 RepID=A0A0E9RTL3_ANGAN